MVSDKFGGQMSLSKQENNTLVGILPKLEWPIDSEVFGVLMTKIVSVPIELCVLDNQNRILTFFRKDREYNGYHLPGTVLRNGESVLHALKRLMQSEVSECDITEPKNIGWVEIPRGKGEGENPTRHEISLLYLSRLPGTYTGNRGIFFPLNGLPGNILSHHRVLIKSLQTYLRRGV